MNKLLSVLLIILILTVAACGQPALQAPDGTTEHAGETAAEQEEAVVEETVEEATEETAAPEEEAAGVTEEETATPETQAEEEEPTAVEEEAGAVMVGDAENGEVLFNEMQPEAGFACATCHRVDSEEQLIGPGLLNIPSRAATRVEGMSAEEYIHTSIVDPGAYVVDGYPDQLMPRNYTDIFDEEQIADLIAYLLTLE